MDRLAFRLEWGYNILYSRRHYHPEMRWDGSITCQGGAIRSLTRLDFPVLWWGLCHSPVRTPLAGTTWTSTTRRGLAGVEVEAEAEADGVFRVETAQGCFTVTARQVAEDGRIVFPVGPAHGHAVLTVTRCGHLWFRPLPRPGEEVVGPEGFAGAQLVEWSRMRQAWIAPASEAAFEVTLDAPPAQGFWLVHLQAMTALPQGQANAYPPDLTATYPFLARLRETQARDYLPLAVLAEDGRELARIRYYLRWHDAGVQILHDLWLRIPLDALPVGRHRLRLANRHPALALLVERLAVRAQRESHLGLTAPAWALRGRPVVVGVRTLHAGSRLELRLDPADAAILDGPEPRQVLAPGIHEFRIEPRRSGLEIPFTVADLARSEAAAGAIGAVYDLPAETPEIRVGYDMTTVPHDDCGDMDWLLAYTHRTQLANLVVFRPFTPPAEGSSYARWGAYCRDHGIGVMAVGGYEDGELIRAAGGQFLALGMHERSFALYAQDPDGLSRDMRHACERYLAFISEDVKRNRRYGRTISYGDASGGHHYSLLAGADALRAETMVAHTTIHLSQARGAARCLGDGQWGVHIAMQHGFQPNLPAHLGAYHLSLYQAWIMGANFLYEEDSLFLMFKDERQCWDDALTKGKRGQTRDFYRFAATHPRQGRPEVPIGVLIGRDAPPFNGFVCGPEQTPDYPVWGRFGSSGPAWGHRQPEKGFHVLDVLMPGANVQPLRQRHDRRRLFFSGSPLGEFDQVPIDAPAGRLADHRLLMLLGWNTAEAADLAKLRDFADAGGTLLLAVPHLGTRRDREVLLAMDDLALIGPDIVRGLCGIEILGRGARFSGSWSAQGPDFADAACPALSRSPNQAPDEDGPCHLARIALCGAESVIDDPVADAPLLTRFRVGKGTVYLLTTWAWPGHEELADLAGAVVATLSERARGPVRVDDPERGIYSSLWPLPVAGCGRAYLLNTDWWRPGNRAGATFTCPAASVPVEVAEGDCTIITWTPLGALVQLDHQPHVEVIAASAEGLALRMHGTGTSTFRFHAGDRAVTGITVDGAGLTVTERSAGCWSFALTWTGGTLADCRIVMAE